MGSRTQDEAGEGLRAIGQGQAHAAFPSGIWAGTEPRRAGMELCEAHWRGQNAAAQGRTVKGQDRGAVGQHQERAPTCPVILPSTNCRLYYRLLSNALIEEALNLAYHGARAQDQS